VGHDLARGRVSVAQRPGVVNLLRRVLAETTVSHGLKPLPDGGGFPARYELVFLAAGVILFSLFVGVIMLPLLLQHLEVADHAQ
ncbi:hypothetical protein KU617_22900, partial [Salmonella enterica subsp. enterica serovar Montevideo]|nr:hypothetical protein [Salmonella enterica subsp. enterica serovar Montevideo]